MTSPAASDSSSIRRAAAKASSASPAPSARPTMTCPAMAIASSTSARKPKSWKAIWWAATRRRADARAHGGGEHEAAQQRRRAHEELGADRHERADAREVGRARSARSSTAANAIAHPELREHRAPGRPVEAPVEAVDEQQLEHDVDDVGRHHDDERRAQVAHAAQPALARQRDERHRHAERGDAQVARRQVGDVAVAAERVHERLGQRRHHGGEDDPGGEREPERLRAERGGLRVAARAVQPRHARGRPVGQEDAQRDEVRQHRRGQRQRRELRRAEMADDRGVDQQVQRLGGQRPEGGQREAQDLAVVGRAAHAGHSTIRPWSGSSRCSPPHRWRPAARRAPARRGVRELGRRHRARAGPRAAPGDPALGHAAVAVRLQRAQRRRPADRGRRAHARGRPPLRAGARGRRGRRAAPRLPRRRGAPRRAAHGRHPRRAAAPHRALGRGARRRRRPHRAALAAGSAPGRRPDEAAPLPPPRRRARRLPRDGHRPRPRAPALGAAQPPRVRADRRARSPTATA